MLSEKPVIATDWSGSTDLVTPKTGFPVSYELRPLEKGEYIETTGQAWAEPNLSHAAYLMQHVRHLTDAERRHVGQAARAHVMRGFSLEANVASYEAAFGMILDSK
jgi:glycosyltransferase involved in cell wall biosynthesis